MKNESGYESVCALKPPATSRIYKKRNEKTKINHLSFSFSGSENKEEASTSRVHLTLPPYTPPVSSLPVVRD